MQGDGGSLGAAWSRRCTLPALGLTVLPAGAMVTLSETARELPVAAWVFGVAAYVVALAATMVVYVAWRITGYPGTAWLVAGMGLVSAQTIAAFALVLSDATRNRASDWQGVLTLPALIALTTVLVLSRRVRLTVDPLLVGVGLGLALAVGRYLFAVAAPPLAEHSLLRASAVLLPVGLLGFMLGFVGRAGLQTSVRWSLGIAVVLLGVGSAALFSSDGAGAGISIGAHVVGSFLVLTAALAVLRLAIEEDHEARKDLEERLERVQASDRLDRARMHEIGSVVAAIASASRLVQHAGGAGSPRRRALEEMLDSEMGRLDRLLNGAPAGVPEIVGLDEIVHPLVVAQRAQGRSVSWSPTDHKLLASPDGLSEVISILLENAARHAPGSPVTITATETADSVHIEISDDGPGVAAEMRGRLFEWEARGASSPGQGIGLHIARGLVTEIGGSLAHVDGDARGATFVIELPVAPDTWDHRVQGSRTA